MDSEAFIIFVCFFALQEKAGGVRSGTNKSDFYNDINMTDNAIGRRKRKSITLVSELVSHGIYSRYDLKILKNAFPVTPFMQNDIS